MERLSKATLPKNIHGVDLPAYNLDEINTGIVHFGTGNFHRAHQAMYCDKMLSQGYTHWGITGISLRSPAVRDNLAPQNFLYTQATLGESDTFEEDHNQKEHNEKEQILSNKNPYRIIGSIQNILVAPENPHAVVNLVAHSQTQVVTSTITEKGYGLLNGEINVEHPDFIQDLKSLEAPQTIYGYLAAALTIRCSAHGTALTVLCCDNIQSGGDHLRKGVNILLTQHNPETLSWVNNKVSFSSSMVDRVTPITNDKLKNDVSEKLKLIDAAPVAAEPFTQWIIEDNFAGERPPFDRAGAIFVKDITPFEQIKLRFLNAGHSILAVLGYLSGDNFVHEALQRPAIAKFTEQALKHNALPVASVPEGMNGENYIDEVLKRFRNSKLPYAVLQVGTDSSLKIQQRWLPTVDDAITQGNDTRYMAFALASWVVFIHKALLNNDLNDPLHESFARVDFSGSESDVLSCLALAGSDQFAYSSNNSFMATVIEFHKTILDTGIESSLNTFLNIG